MRPVYPSTPHCSCWGVMDPNTWTSADGRRVEQCAVCGWITADAPEED